MDDKKDELTPAVEAVVTESKKLDVQSDGQNTAHGVIKDGKAKPVLEEFDLNDIELIESKVFA